MTAIVAVLNRGGVALAADRATTVLGGYGQEKRVFSTVTKIHKLSERHPVAVATYQADDFMGIPIETLIASYRNQLGTTSFNTVADYANDFLVFLRSRMVEIAPFEQSLCEIEIFFTREFLPKMRGIIADGYSRLSKPATQLDQEQKEQAAQQAIERVIADFADAPLCDGLTEGDIDRFAGLYTANMIDLIRVALIDEPLNDYTKTLLAKAAIRVFCTSTEPIISMAGLVFVGFGEREFFPVVLGCGLRGALGETLIYTKGEGSTVDSANTAAILPFAQRGTADLLINGTHPDLLPAIQTRVHTVLMDVYRRFTHDAYTDTPKQDYEAVAAANKAACDKLAQGIADDLQQYADNRFYSTSLAAVAALPKSKLADTARGMVEAAITQQLLMPSLATVGGGVDTVIITKGGGVEWANSKMG